MSGPRTAARRLVAVPRFGRSSRRALAARLSPASCLASRSRCSRPSHRPATGAAPGERKAQRADRAGLVGCLLWCGYLLFSPFYLFDSGQPQVADYLLLALLLWLLLLRGGTLRPWSTHITRATLIMVAYFAGVNLVWLIEVRDPELALHGAFYVFNFLCMLSFVGMYRWMGRRFLDLTGGCVAASVLLQAALSLGYNGLHPTRETLFFNNPNQLGYFVVLYSSLFWIWSRARRGATWRAAALEVLVYAASLYLALMAQSRAAIAALLLLVALRLFLHLSVGALVAITLGGMFLARGDRTTLEGFETRVHRQTRTAIDELYYRGYDRLLNHPQYLVLGAGEGAYWRFRSQHPRELHSSLGTVLFCYGAVGLALLVRLLRVVARETGLRELFFLAPIAAYGLTHNGLRQAEVWIAIALVVCLHARRRRAVAAGVAPASARWPAAAAPARWSPAPVAGQ